MKFKYKTQPYEHQRIALERSYDKENYGYFMEMGCGKSKVLIDSILSKIKSKPLSKPSFLIL